MLRQILFRENKSKYFIIIATLIVSLLLSSRVLAGNFSDHFGIIKDNKKVTPEQEVEFIKKDKEYLTNISAPNNQSLNSEIMELEKELDKVKDEYVSTKNNIKVYTGNAVLKNNALRTAIINRKNLIISKNAFEYDDRSKYMIERGYDKETRARANFSQKDLDVAVASVIEVIESLEIDTSFLNKTSFVVSPHKIEGINGYTVTRSDGNHTVIVSKQVAFAPETWTVKNIKSTTLHEIGHVFYNNKNIAKLNSGLVSKYSVSNLPADTSLNVDAWKESPTENFAEDFKMFLSDKLGEKSFEPTKKQTSQPYDESSFTKLMETLY